MANGNYIDPALGGVGGTVGVISGIQEGDPREVARGTGELLGAYTTANSIITQQAFDMAYDAAIDTGATVLEATAAADAAAASAGLTGAQAVGQYIPYIGLGIALWNIGEEGLTWGTGAGLAAAVAPWGLAAIGANPYALTVGLPVMLQLAYSSWRDKEKWEKGRKNVYFQNSEVTSVGKDEEGWYYLRLTNGLQPEGLDVGDTVRDTGLYIMLRYNPQTNELQQVKDYQPAYIDEGEKEWNTLEEEGRQKYGGGSLSERHPDLTIEEWIQVQEGGFVVKKKELAPDPNWSEQYARTHRMYQNFIYVKEGFEPTEEFNRILADTSIQGFKRNQPISESGADYSSVVHVQDMNSYNWETFDPSDPIRITHHDRRALVWNIPQLQASIYNNILVPEGLAPSATETFRQITINGENYLTDGTYIANVSGQLVGSVNTETGEFYDFNITAGWRFDSDFEGPRNDAPPPYIVLGVVDNWGEIKNTFVSETTDSVLPEYQQPGTDSPTVPDASSESPPVDSGLPQFQQPGTSSQPTTQGSDSPPPATPEVSTEEVADTEVSTEEEIVPGQPPIPNIEAKPIELPTFYSERSEQEGLYSNMTKALELPYFGNQENSVSKLPEFRP